MTEDMLEVVNHTSNKLFIRAIDSKSKMKVGMFLSPEGHGVNSRTKIGKIFDILEIKAEEDIEPVED